MSVRITIIGTGYVGLVTGACFADLGHHVICVDSDAHKIGAIQAGDLPIYEPGLDDVVKRNVAAGRLAFSSNTEESVKDREIVFIAVGTPSEPETGRADLQYVFEAAAEVSRHLDTFTVIVTKSTVPVGSNRRVYEKMSQSRNGDCIFAVGSNPEFLREGAAIRDFLEPDRIVIGTDDERAAEILRRVYAPLISREVPLVETNIETAEMIKYAANAFLAVKVSFINEVSNLCELVGADVRGVAKGIGLDKRIGQAFLSAGPGWGGSCFPKDTRALSRTAKDARVDCEIVDAAIRANENRKASMVSKVRDICDGALNGSRIGVLGLTFKGQTDDMRESASLEILPALVAEGAIVSAYDPSQPKGASRLLPTVRIATSPESALRDADLVIVLTDWMIFKSYDLQELALVMAKPTMLDLRNLFEEDQVLSCGFQKYQGLGS